MFDNMETGLTTDEGFREEDFNKVIEDSQYHVYGVETGDPLPAPGKQSRWLSWAAWTAIVGLISIVCSAFNVWEHIGITAEWFDKIAAAVGAVLTAFGVFNNPTNREGF